MPPKIKSNVPKRRIVSEPLNFSALALDVSKDWSLVNEPTLKKEELSSLKLHNPWIKEFEDFQIAELGTDEESKSSNSSKSA